MRVPYIPLFLGLWIFKREISEAENVELVHTISSSLLAVECSKLVWVAIGFGGRCW